MKRRRWVSVFPIIIFGVLAAPYALMAHAGIYELITPNFTKNGYPWEGLPTTQDHMTVRFTTPTKDWFSLPGYYSPTWTGNLNPGEYITTVGANTLRMSSDGINFVGNASNVNANGYAAYIGAVDQFGAPTQYSFRLMRNYVFPNSPPAFPNPTHYSETVEISVSSLPGSGRQASVISLNGYGAYIQLPYTSPWPSFRLLTFYNGDFMDGMTGWDTGGLASPTLDSYLGKQAVKFGNPSNYWGTLEQDLQTTPGQYYELSYSLAGTGSEFYSQLDGTKFFDTVNANFPAYTTITKTFQATSDETELLFYGKASGSFYLADVSLIEVNAPPPPPPPPTSTPEPATLALLGLGLAGLGFSRRKQ